MKAKNRLIFPFQFSHQNVCIISSSITTEQILNIDLLKKGSRGRCLGVGHEQNKKHTQKEKISYV